MLINIASLNVRTLYPCPEDYTPGEEDIPFEYPDRDEGESIEHYTERKYEEKINTLRKYFTIAAKSERRRGDYLFFTLPEFFWNVSPYTLKTREDLDYVREYYLNNVKTIITNLMEEFPSDEYGKIVFLAGSTGVLLEVEGESYDYESYNHLLCVNNFNAEYLV